MRGFFRALLCAAIVPCVLSAPLRAKPHFETVSLGFKTYLTGINNNGAIVGYIVDSAQRGFIRQPDGTVTFFDITEPYARNLTTTGINDNGHVTGYYSTIVGSQFIGRGFVRTADGTITRFGLPKGDNTVQGNFVNSSGTVFGNYDRSKSLWYGFERQPDGTTTKPTCNSAPFIIRGANDSGQATGSLNSGGLVLNPDGSCTQFEGAYPYAINAEGSVAGVTGIYPYATDFLRTPDGTITNYTIPAVYDEAFPVGINANRVIAGWFKLGVYGHPRGYVRGSNGKVTIFEASAPGVGDASSENTTPAAINDAGVIVGVFYGPQIGSEATGFIRYP